MSLDLKLEKLVNGQDKKDLNVILERMDQADKDREQIHQDIKFIKENPNDPLAKKLSGATSVADNLAALAYLA